MPGAANESEKKQDDIRFVGDITFSDRIEVLPRAREDFAALLDDVGVHGTNSETHTYAKVLVDRALEELGRGEQRTAKFIEALCATLRDQPMVGHQLSRFIDHTMSNVLDAPELSEQVPNKSLLGQARRQFKTRHPADN